jgi:haloacetate dehalogenase
MNRRQFSALGFASLLATLSRAQGLTDGTTMPPSSENLAKELPSTQPCGVLAELPAPPDESVNEKLFPGFQASGVKTSGATIRVFTKGEGQPLLLIHGHPETHVTWHKIAFLLAEQYTVIVPDLRGYGDSSKPGYSPDQTTLSARWRRTKSM